MTFRKPRIKFGTTSNSIYIEDLDNDKFIIKNNDVDVIAISGVSTQPTLQVKSTEAKIEVLNTTSEGNSYAEVSMGIVSGDKWKLSGGLEDKTDSDYNFHIIKNNDEYLTINNNGNIGIGITNPNYKLEVNGAANIKENCFVQGNLIIKGITASAAEITDNLWTEDGNGNIYSSKSINIGIGTTNPQNKIDINGNIGVSGHIYGYTDELYDIGSTTNKFNNIYIKKVYLEDVEITKLNNKLNINVATRVNGNLDVEGDLNVYGNAVTFDIETIQVEDGLIQLASNNTADVIDSGFYTQFSEGGVTKYSGLIRDASDGVYNLFTDLETEPTTVINKSANGYSSANLNVKDFNSVNINNTSLISCGSLNVTGNNNIAGTLTVTGGLTLNNTLDVTGEIKATICNTTGAVGNILVDSLSTTGLSTTNYTTHKLTFNTISSMEDDLQHYMIHIRGEITGLGSPNVDKPNISWRAIDTLGEINDTNSYRNEIVTNSGTSVVSSSRSTYGDLIWCDAGASTSTTKIFTSILNVWIGTASRPYDTSIIGESNCYSVDGVDSQNNKISSSLTSLATIDTNLTGIGFISKNSNANTRFNARIFRMK